MHAMWHAEQDFRDDILAPKLKMMLYDESRSRKMWSRDRSPVVPTEGSIMRVSNLGS